ncbi:MAG: hypothetical protein V2A55_02430 [Candidatus Jorgensenbacteria bacterium]
MKKFLKKVLFVLGCLIPAPLIFGGAALRQYEAVPPTQQVVVTTEEFVVVKGSTLWDLAYEKCGDALRWEEIYGFNPYLEEQGRLSVRNGRQIVLVFPGEHLAIPTVGCQGASSVVVPASEAPVPVAAGSVAGAEEASSLGPWWVWALLVIALVAVVCFFADNRRFRRVVARLEETIKSLRSELRNMDELLDNERVSHERRLAEQRRADFVIMRGHMPPLPDGVEDGVMAGPPSQFEGVTEANREEILDDAAQAAYQRLHQGADMFDLTFERQNERRVLISSRPGRTFEVTYGDDTRREVVLVREPGWILDVVVRRGDEIVDEFKGVCVLGFCANVIQYRRNWIEGALIEPFEYAAIHSAPDWEAVEQAERARRQASRRVTVRAVGNRVIGFLDDEPVIEGDYVVIETKAPVEPGANFLGFSGRATLAGVDEPVAEPEPDIQSAPEPETVETPAAS